MLEMIPNTPPVGLVRVLGTDGVPGRRRGRIAAPPARCRCYGDVAQFPAGCGWSDQALADDEHLARRPGTLRPRRRSHGLKKRSDRSKATNLYETGVSSWDAAAPSQVKVVRGPPCSGPSARWSA